MKYHRTAYKFHRISEEIFSFLNGAILSLKSENSLFLTSIAYAMLAK